ncbi:glycosyltransferase family 39 protein [Actinomadura flavalba]|uniref:glycosyltransferase family 39 protein n=1 Tax=Actinomadura flavalba TaxID=1120938 RepID=UPI0003A9F14E|nr:glycosyltransferase family 39 protein [Actinomadura flavalba]
MVQATAAETQAEEDGAARRRPPWRRIAALSGLVTVVGVVVQWVIMTPPLYYDPYYVWLGARDWPDVPLDRWPFVELPHQVTRIGLVLPARAVQELLGTGQAAYFVIAALAGCVFFVGTYLAVRSLFGDVAGVASALLLIVHPFFTLTNPYTHEITWSAGVLLPDMPGAGLFAAGMAGLVAASRRTGRAQTRMLVVAGLLLGSSFLVREFLAFLFLAIPAYLWLLRIPWRRNVTVGLTMLAVLAANFVHNVIVWGTPLAGLRSAAGHGGKSWDVVTRPLAANSFWRAMTEGNPLGLVFVALLALTIVGWAVTRDRRLALCLVWFFTLAVPLTLLSGVLDPDDISLRAWLIRYWFAVLPALLAGGIGAVTLLARRVPAAWTARLRPVAFGAAVLGVVAYLGAAFAAVPDLPRDRAWNELRVWLDGRDDLPAITTDGRLAQTFTFYARDMWGNVQWNGRVVTFPQYAVGDPPTTEYPMLYHRWRGMEASAPVLGGWKPGEHGWTLAWRSSDGLLEIWNPPAR